MTSEEYERVNKAIRDCLAFCYQGEQVIPRLAEFLSQLKAAGWRQSEIHEVEIAVLKVLQGIMHGATLAGDAPNVPNSDLGEPESKSPNVNGA